MTLLDLDHVRRQFPALQDPVLGARVFLENAGGSYPARQVTELLAGYYARTKVQPGHPHPAAQAAAAAMDAGHEAVAGWLGVEQHRVQVGPSTSQNTYVLANALRAVLPAGAALVVTQQDHEANRGAWLRLADAGFEVREWPVDPVTGLLDVADLERLLDERVEVVAFPHVSNLVGETNDVARIAGLAHEAGAIAVVDGVAAAPHGLPWVDDLGADVHLFSAYKTYGPHQGVMTVTAELLERLPNQGHHFNAHLPAKRLVPAGPDHAQVAALAGVVAYLEDLDAHHHATDGATPAERTRRVARLQREHEARVFGPLLTHLHGRQDVRVLGTDDPTTHVPTVSVITPRPPVEIATELAEHGIDCAGGHFYAHRLCEAVGVDPAHGVLRLSAVHTASHDDVTRTIEALEQVL